MDTPQASAEAGRFDEAVKLETEAQNLYTDEQRREWSLLLERYKQRQPYHRELG